MESNQASMVDILTLDLFKGQKFIFQKCRVGRCIASSGEWSDLAGSVPPDN